MTRPAPLPTFYVFLVLTALGIGCAMADELPPQLKTSITVTADVIRVGDLWDNTGDKAHSPAAQAPLPGRHATLDARWLASVAASNGLNWHPTSNYDHAVVERAGQSIDIADIETELREALAMEGFPRDGEFEINNRANLSVVIPTGVTPSITIKDLVYDHRTQRFQATVEVPYGDSGTSRVRVTGRTFATTRVPTLSHAINRGEVITDRDIVMAEIRDDALRSDMITEPKRLIGMEPKVLLRANMPLHLNDIQRPTLVTRNGLVTMVVRTPFMTLTAQGRSLDEGGLGDSVRVTNLQTKQIVEARVQGSGSVVITAAQNAPMAQTAANN